MHIAKYLTLPTYRESTSPYLIILLTGLSSGLQLPMDICKGQEVGGKVNTIYLAFMGFLLVFQ